MPAGSKLNCRDSNEAEDGNDTGWNGSDENPPVLPSSGPEAMTPIWNKIESEASKQTQPHAQAAPVSTCLQYITINRTAEHDEVANTCKQMLGWV
jgi:hypothetical protein